ncbi:unnamed protein product, partial [Closterium sp. NIES-53]
MTVHYDSDVPVQYGSWEEYDIMRPPVPKTALLLFLVVMTVHYDSDVPVQYGSWEEYDIMRPPVPKTADAIAAAFISNCAANNFRLKAVEELQKFFPVHSYGRCLNNRPFEHDKKIFPVHSYGRYLNNRPFEHDK